MGVETKSPRFPENSGACKVYQQQQELMRRVAAAVNVVIIWRIMAVF
jgi:hypothetical protein